MSTNAEKLVRWRTLDGKFSCLMQEDQPALSTPAGRPPPLLECGPPLHIRALVRFSLFYCPFIKYTSCSKTCLTKNS